MGSPSFFEDSDLLDWFSELEDKQGSVIFVRQTLKAVSKQGYLDSYDAGRAIGASEWVASLRGNKAAGAGDLIDALLAQFAPKVPQEIVTACLGSLERVNDSSEIRDRWEEAGFLEQWNVHLADLRSRLIAEPIPIARLKRVRIRTGDVFRLDLSNGRSSYGRVYDHLGGVIEVFAQGVTPRGEHPAEAAFTVLIERGPLELGRWPVVARGSASTIDSPAPLMFEQEGFHFRLRRGGTGRPASVRECRGLEVARYWAATAVIERVLRGECSPGLARYWPMCLVERDGLGPKCWSEWSEADFGRMEEAAKRSKPSPLFS